MHDGTPTPVLRPQPPVGDAPDRVVLDAVVPAAWRGQRLDKAARALFPDISRSELAGWLRDGQATLDGAPAKPKLLVRGGERIRVRATRRRRVDWRAVDHVRFRIAYEDEDLVVVDKPAGVVVHPGAGNARGTLVNGLLGARPELAHLPRAGLVQRLDKDTSGLLVVAANSKALLRLGDAMRGRRIDRWYLAVVEGRMVAGGRVELAMGRDRRNRLRQRVRADGRPAVTDVYVRARYAAHTLVEARLGTGRTHQVRVHLAALGHPLVGDRRYGARGVVPPAASADHAALARAFGRQALHAYHLGFAHPSTGETMTFRSQPPTDMRELLRALDPAQGDSA